MSLIPVYAGKIEQLTEAGQPGGVPLENYITGFRGASAIQAFRVNCGATAIVVAFSDVTRRTLTMKNEGANDIFIGGEDLTISNGYRLASGDALTLELAGELWGITAGTTEALYCLAEVDQL
jgi:hypothetical protein